MHLTNINRHQFFLNAQQKCAVNYIQTYLSNWSGAHSTKSLYYDLLAGYNLSELALKKFQQIQLGSQQDAQTLLNNY